MNNRVLRWSSIILPVLFWVVIFLVRYFIFEDVHHLAVYLIEFTIVGIGAFLFSRWVFGVVDRREDEVHQRTQQLEALRSAALTLTTELDLSVVLQKVVDLSRELVHAKYGALGVLDVDGEHIEHFITSGIDPEIGAKIGGPPLGRGLLGAMLRKGKPTRISDIGEDERSVGFPKAHPAMQSMLGVPIISKGKIIGNLYLTDKQSTTTEGKAATFTEQDQQVVEMFATQAAIAIENAQLIRQTQQLAILEERERFGMDLHDGIIQSIYAIGLGLEVIQHRMGEPEQEARKGLNKTILDLNDVIRDIRNYILDLRPQRFQGRDLMQGLDELVRDLRTNSFLKVEIEDCACYLEGLEAEMTVEVLHVAQEALTNIRKHARATQVEIELLCENDLVELRISDNGIGILEKPPDETSGNGLRNMRERASVLGGDIRFEESSGGGTCVRLFVPFKHFSSS